MSAEKKTSGADDPLSLLREDVAGLREEHRLTRKSVDDLLRRAYPLMHYSPDASPLTLLKMAREAFLHHPRWSVRLAAAVCPKIDDAIAALEGEADDS